MGECVLGLWVLWVPLGDQASSVPRGHALGLVPTMLERTVTLSPTWQCSWFRGPPGNSPLNILSVFSLGGGIDLGSPFAPARPPPNPVSVLLLLARVFSLSKGLELGC